MQIATRIEICGVPADRNAIAAQVTPEVLRTSQGSEAIGAFDYIATAAKRKRSAKFGIRGKFAIDAVEVIVSR